MRLQSTDNSVCVCVCVMCACFSPPRRGTERGEGGGRRESVRVLVLNM